MSRRGVDQAFLDRRSLKSEIAARLEDGSGDGIAFVASGMSPLLYRDLLAEIDSLALALESAGVTAGARIGVSMSEAPRAALAIVCAAACATAVPFDPRLTPVELEERVGRLKLSAVCLLAGSDLPLRDIAARHGVPVLEATPDAPDKLTCGYAWATPVTKGGDAADDGIDAAVILPSSGTTAASKLIPYSLDNIVATAERVRGWYGLAPEDRCLSISPVYYCHGLILTVLGPLLSGGSVAFPKNPAQPDLQEWLVDLRPTWLSTAPAVHLALLERIKAERFSGPISLRFAVSGGATLPANLQAELQSILDVPVLEHYGATEAGQIASNVLPPGPFKPGTCGVPDPTVVRIVVEPGANLPPGWGEVFIGGPSLTAGYLDAPEINRVSFFDGWFRTGDIGALDEDGFLVLHGRLKEIINRGGEKISPAEVEAALLRHPAVREAAAVAVPHPRLGEDIAAFVVLREGTAPTPAPEEMRKFLSSQLAWFKIPRRITFVEALPRGSTGKVQRNRLLGEVR